MAQTGKMGSYDRPGKEKFERKGDNPKKKLYSRDKKLNAGLKKVDRQYKEAVKSAAGTDMLLTEEAGFLEADDPMERTFKFKQDDIAKVADQGTANKQFKLSLPDYGSYDVDLTRNGRQLLLGGKKGHVASMDWRTGKLDCELFLNETVNAVKHLHNDQYFAVAQKKYTFIYDKTGLELHRLKQHIEATLLDFLPYHLLLTTAGNTGFLKYHDVSTGQLVSEIRTKLGPTQAMKQNPWNGVMHLGHANGTVSLWSPSMSTPLVKIQCARGPIRDVAIDREGKYMVTGGMDKSLKLWDIRNFKQLDEYFSPTPVQSLDISDNGLVSTGWNTHVTIWKDMFKSKQNSPYMNHLLPSDRVEKLKFIPFEDFLTVGSSKSVENIVVPGAGEANFDALELNPFETTKQRQQNEVRSLMNKLSPDTITLDPNVIGTVDKRANSIRLKPGEMADIAKDDKLSIKPEVKGKNSALRKHLRKKTQNVVDQRKLRIERNLALEKQARKKRHNEFKGIENDDDNDVLNPVLDRFN